PGYRLQPGFSGAPVWDSDWSGVVGMVVAAERDAVTKVGVVIPSDLVLRACRALAPAERRRPFNGLADGLEGLPGSPVNGCEQFLVEYVGTSQRVVPFGGRDDELHMLD